MKNSARQKGVCRSSLMLHHLVTRDLLPALPDHPKVPAEAVCLASINLDELQGNLRDRDLDLILSHWLSTEERTLLSRFSLPKRRIEWLGGRMTAKTALLHLAADDNLPPTPSLLPILPKASGRPFCDRRLFDRHGAPLMFSISHTGNSAMALAVAGFSCGIDIQIVSPTLLGIQEKFCNHPERKGLQLNERVFTLNKTEQLALLWCSKEAFRKSLDVTPLPAFREMELQGRPETVANVLHLPMRFRRNEYCLDFSATAWLQAGAAAALTIIAEPGGSTHG